MLCFTTPTLDCVAPFNPPEACIQQQHFIKLSTVLGTVPVLYLGLGFGGSPRLQQQQRQGVSILHGELICPGNVIEDAAVPTEDASLHCTRESVGSKHCL